MSLSLGSSFRATDLMILTELRAEASNHRRSGEFIQAEKILKRCYDSAPDDADVQRGLFDLYQQNLAALKSSPYRDYPLFVVLETLALCNAKCGFCPYPTMERLGTKMPDQQIDKIISGLKAIPQTGPQSNSANNSISIFTVQGERPFRRASVVFHHW
jgi:sulfatase maturation enzyme AslB (radical SAM superfamily)